MYFDGKGLMIKMKVRIEDIADALDMTMDSWEQYLNTETGEIVSLADGMWVDRDEELEEEIEFSDCYVRLPNQYDIHEWNIMEEFAESLASEKNQKRLLSALHGRKAYRNFKDEIFNLGVEKAYYDYRSIALLRIAKRWCDENGIIYIQ